MEVCVDCVRSAINGEKGGASRIELCSNLVEGGTTPNIGVLKVMKQKVKIPVFVMIRPRGGDFCYDELEMAVMKLDIQALKEAGADGFVFGILNSDGTVNVTACKVLIDEASPMPVTFHRAIDMTKDIYQSVSEIVDLGFQRVLTSGGHSTAFEGKEVISKIVKKFGDEIIIIPGGGINTANLEAILECKVKEFHGTGRESLDSSMTFQKKNISMGAIAGSEFILKHTSQHIISELMDIAKSVWSRI